MAAASVVMSPAATTPSSSSNLPTSYVARTTPPRLHCVVATTSTLWERAALNAFNKPARRAGAVPVPYSSNTTALNSSDSRQRSNALSSKPGTMRKTKIFVSICVNALHLCSEDGANAKS